MLISTDHWTVTIVLDWMIPEYFAFCMITPTTSHTSSLLFFTQHSQNALYSQPFWKPTVKAKALYISVRHTGHIQIFLCQCSACISSLTTGSGSGVIIAVIIICLLLIAILGSVLYFLYKKGKLPCGRSGKQDLYVFLYEKMNIIKKV